VLKVRQGANMNMSISQSINEELRMLAAELQRTAASLDDPMIAHRLIEMADETLSLISDPAGE
jgi:hypothetical protein